MAKIKDPKIQTRLPAPKRSDGGQGSKEPKKIQKQKSATKTSNLTVDVVDIAGKKKGTMELPKELFDAAVNTSLMAQAVRVYQINQRQGGAIAQTRGEVTGSRRKIWRQKGTGRARHGDRYASIFVGGGKAHGPRPRPFEKSMSRKMKQLALCSALTSQFKNERVIVVEGFEKLEAKTKAFIKALNSITGHVKHGKVQEKMIVATPKKIDVLYRAGRNIENLTVQDARLLHTYDVLNTKRLIFSKDAISVLQETIIKS
ncbi:50S ribosomal protein L4 [Candidatus Roizmanbacteria bacterium RIFCSPLOWO2_01_FULL_40_14]|uniref:Large ribosomal subunit protein uL4 n=3 Tax=Candidatus Roizmaniibacteriota TaxID=1752723 RepID=A0A0G0ZBM9_9BACT|nr:MAG: 50S ribosomal protein L4 [Candidatus Roizmanbacteria bacterium GW2011_GWB1_40_7]KKR94554.1 MAG: 50S ribosomal protein L4 [Candidatus Roizmanbacteria bacterium GW2011_GWA1_41_13]KKS19486.1 MAG: 50S ribosomal protein L4 [Candidatus Roizmanbacteria bacterium GW2011_GWC2_41_7]OGK48426.1 MAG: 50S ribosomal protein L4 [Candidatus Roizmanbacteria bacterium RIFCSPLOWO2_01_FULL_40_14]